VCPALLLCSASALNFNQQPHYQAWAAHRVMFLPLELGWVLPVTAPEWSQLQLVPNIVYRIDSMLQVCA
jgi:hypothetical protein